MTVPYSEVRAEAHVIDPGNGGEVVYVVEQTT